MTTGDPGAPKGLFVRRGNSNGWTINFGHPGAPWVVIAIVLLAVVLAKLGVLTPKQSNLFASPTQATSSQAGR